MKLTQYSGDSVTHTIPLKWQGAAFTPGTDWGLVFTAKRSARDADAAAVFQKASGAGIIASGSNALVSTVALDTVALGTMTLVWDIQAVHATLGTVRTVAFGPLEIKRDITREVTTSTTVHTTETPLPFGGGGDTRYDLGQQSGAITPALADGNYQYFWLPPDDDPNVTLYAPSGSATEGDRFTFAVQWVSGAYTLNFSGIQLPVGVAALLPVTLEIWRSYRIGLYFSGGQWCLQSLSGPFIESID